jgi:hypothetical protein
VAKAGLAALAVGGILLVGCSLPVHVADSDHLVSAHERLATLRRAQLWKPTNVAAMDIRTGPKSHAFAPGETVTCRFTDKKFGGNTPKFGCAAEDGDHEVLKVRYGRDNGELYAGVASTRLLWALGFGADAMYPVRVVCEGCPKKMAREGTASADAITFDVAAIERKFPGRDVDAKGGMPGWAWPELDLVDPDVGGAPSSQRDALKLLAVLLQHTDNKPEQQRLVCLDRDARDEQGACAEPFMMIHDLGQTFGRANLFDRAPLSSVNFDRWSKTEIWSDPARCIGNLAPSQRGTLTDPEISEGGRSFLANLLTQLTDQQLHDLFDVARFADKPHGGAPVDAWVAAFQHKRNEIVSAHCR